METSTLEFLRLEEKSDSATLEPLGLLEALVGSVEGEVVKEGKPGTRRDGLDVEGATEAPPPANRP